jgi:SAM-dependent methyltransferase
MFRRHDYMTIDPEPKKNAFGASRHFVDGIQNIAQYVKPASIDTIICNGVLGFGVNTLEQANASFQACRDVLRPGGELVIGWNDGPNERPFALEEVDALQSFDRIAFEPIGQKVLRVPTAYSYAYEFFAKPVLAS